MTLLAIASIAGLAAVTERGPGSDGTDEATASVRLYETAVPPQRSRSVTAASSAPDSGALDALVVARALPGADTCRSARKALRYYRGVAASWWRKMGAGDGPWRARVGTTCPRYLAKVARAKARAARAQYGRWWAYHWDWPSWLPDKWQRVGACETGYGRRPGQWTWNSGTYQGAFGFYHGSWDAFVPHASRRAAPYPSEAYLATPRQQYEVALAIWRRYGFSGWGCRGA